MVLFRRPPRRPQKSLGENNPLAQAVAVVASVQAAAASVVLLYNCPYIHHYK
jgi:hypothetical protein